jgi:hypothetical protein
LGFELKDLVRQLIPRRGKLKGESEPRGLRQKGRGQGRDIRDKGKRRIQLPEEKLLPRPGFFYRLKR